MTGALDPGHAVLTDEQKVQMAHIKTLEAGFIQVCKDLGGSRELSLAITKMEEASMWATKHIAKED